MYAIGTKFLHKTTGDVFKYTGNYGQMLIFVNERTLAEIYVTEEFLGFYETVEIH